MLRVPRCSLLDIAVLMLPVWLLILMSHTIADVDLWGHLRFGLDLLGGRGLARIDPYSFTSDVSWINHEWLAEAAIAAAFSIAGAAGLNVVKLAVIGAIALIAYRGALRAGASGRSAVVLTSVVVFATYTRTQVLRPQLFSVFLFAAMLELLDTSAFDSRNRRVGIPLIFCLWSNLHGGWLVGFATLGAWLSAELVEIRSLHAAVRGCTILLSALAASAINPYGFALWGFLHGTVELSRADISDWAPFLQLPPSVIAIDLILPVIALVSSVLCGRIPKVRYAAAIAVLLFATARVGRVDAFLQIALGLLLAPVIVEALDRASRVLAPFDRLTVPSAVNGLAASAIVLGAIGFAAPRLRHISVEGPWIPDREAMLFLRAESSPTRLLTWFDWGEYAIWHLSDAGVQVSMDGRRETVYSERVLDDHWSFYRNEGDAWRYPGRIGADRVWLPRRFPVLDALRAHGWHVAFESERSVVLSREPRQTLIAASQDGSPKFFPYQ